MGRGGEKIAAKRGLADDGKRFEALDVVVAGESYVTKWNMGKGPGGGDTGIAPGHWLVDSESMLLSRTRVPSAGVTPFRKIVENVENCSTYSEICLFSIYRIWSPTKRLSNIGRFVEEAFA